MELLNYGMASSSEQQAVSTGQPVLANSGNMVQDQPSTEGVNDWLEYETLQNGEKEYVGANNAAAGANANLNPSASVNPSEPSLNVNANASASASVSASVSVSVSVSASSTPAPAPAPIAVEKAAHEDEQPENEPYSIVNTSTEQPPKRKQGRPPKVKGDGNDTSPVRVQMSDDTVVMPKRGRGRPPKNASGAAPPVVPPICIQVNEDSVVDAGAIPKRKPGRPPKAKPQATTLLTDFGEMLEDSDPATVVTAKRRGRPPKTEEQSGEKRRRGRPPKAKTENGEPQAAARAPATNGDSDMFRLESTGAEEDRFVFEGHSDSIEHERMNVTVDPQPKRGRGRPPKDKSATLGDAPKRSPPKQRSPPKPKRAPGEPPRKRGRPPKAAKLAENGEAAAVTKVQLDSSAFDGAQPAAEASSFGENAAAVGGETEVFGFGDMPAATATGTAAAASASTNVTLNGAADSAKRKRGRPPKVKAAVEPVENA